MKPEYNAGPLQIGDRVRFESGYGTMTGTVAEVRTSGMGTPFYKIAVPSKKTGKPRKYGTWQSQVIEKVGA